MATERPPWCLINDTLLNNKCFLCSQTFLRGFIKYIISISLLLCLYYDNSSISLLGKQKKVYQVSQLVSFCTNRYQLLSDFEINFSGNEFSDFKSLTEEKNNENNENFHQYTANLSSYQRALLGPIHSTNLEKIFQDYSRLEFLARENKTNPKTAINLLEKIFQENDIELWMSGLVCHREDCFREYIKLVPTSAPRDEEVIPENNNNNNNNDNIEGSMNEKKKKQNVMQFGRNIKDCPPDCGCDNPWPFLS
jgi:hypothetical protein